MRIIQIEVRGGRTINLGNFNSQRIEFALTAELGPEDNPEECQRQLYGNIKRKLDAIEAKCRQPNVADLPVLPRKNISQAR
jgi:hypothetical protein